MNIYEVVVIGGGPGGYVAAIRAAKLGKKVALVEARDLGGTCLNRGCIPSKTLLRHAEVIESIEKAKSWGIETGELTFSLSKMLARKDAVIQQLRNGISYLLKQGKIDVYNGFAQVKSGGDITIQLADKEEVIHAEKTILATGSKPIVPPIDGIETAKYYTSDTIFNIEKIPESMVIVGGGIIGVELACIFASLKVPVTIIEMGDRIIPGEEPEASKALAKSLKKKGISILTKTKVMKIDQQQIHIETDQGKKEIFETEAILMAVGRAPNTSAFSELNLEMDGPFVKVNEEMITSNPAVYAVGDVIGGWLLAHSASAEGMIAAANAAGEKQTINYQLVPRCVYTSPEVASVGMTEAEAKQKGIDYKVVTVPHSGNGRALAHGEAEGFTKLIAGTKYGEILGVLMVGPHVTEMIAEPSAFIHLEGTVDELASMIHAHPTITESLYEAAASWTGQGVHH
ncbi:dihydrolipoamide dehydrogenase [Jeotgalibacillus malaysiensis]|uniref:Dihydrolipoyl dehydrogenase n=1 Tax=Jeotgalibacillus malaysiensis TaxID=1508404 RepID=A0A0B5ANH8_9BACL|nr:dihydrolipoyl dehydrogenase [Jeotgalibacillus malaysiensis]AJD90222.1 dihydrolipoamide dehydrogenase [Jeotgalibacillus malaysiensis]